MRAGISAVPWRERAMGRTELLHQPFGRRERNGPVPLDPPRQVSTGAVLQHQVDVPLRALRIHGQGQPRRPGNRPTAATLPIWATVDSSVPPAHFAPAAAAAAAAAAKCNATLRYLDAVEADDVWVLQPAHDGYLRL